MDSKQSTPLDLVVDIGNSGLKLAFLSDCAPSNHPADQSWLLTPVDRIAWQSEPLLASRSQTEPLPAGLLLSANVNDPAWAEQLVTHVAQFADDRTDFGCRWFASSVQRTATALLMEAIQRERQADSWHIVKANSLDWQMKVDFPDTVGSDRAIAAWAALRTIGKGPLIIVQAGTAVTVDLVDESDAFHGGAILPGMPLALQLLGRGTDLLPELKQMEWMDELPPLPGRNTEAAMLAGVSSAVLGGIDHLIDRYLQRLPASTPIVVSGGNRWLVAHHLRHQAIVIDHLVLRGLALVRTHRIASEQTNRARLP